MLKVDIHSIAGEKKSSMTLPKEIFGQKVNHSLLAQAVHIYRHNQRAYTSHTKTRAEVRGGGRKPWRQKGTGRARHGSTRQPQWSGGGIVFGPRAIKPRLQKLSKKMRKSALISALSLKAETNNIVVVDSLKMDIPKTSEAVALVANMPIDKTVLLINLENDKVLQKAFSNVSKIEVLFIDNLNVYELLKYQTLVLTRDVLSALESRLLSPEKEAKSKPAAAKSEPKSVKPKKTSK